MKSNTVGVLGLGEVGSAIEIILKRKYIVYKKDLNQDTIKNKKIDILHVCIPFSVHFEKIVLRQIVVNNPKLVIINSTVNPSTTERIFKKSKVPTVHSPVMGTHPNLEKDIRTFTKIIGPVNKNSATLAVEHFKSVSIKTEVFNSSQESEIAKLLDTAYYGWNIIFAKLAWELCQKSGVDFKNVYTELNKIYNKGYSESQPNVLRPILQYQPGPIGGHCIILNALILDQFIKNSITKNLLKENKKF